MSKPKMELVNGNEAIARGAMAAGCKFYFGYPITPQNEIPEYLSKHLPEVEGTFIQAESEIASINMLLGAGATGARAMTSSSSPGHLLKAGRHFLYGRVRDSRSHRQYEPQRAGIGGHFPVSRGLFSGHPGRRSWRLPDHRPGPFFRPGKL